MNEIDPYFQAAAGLTKFHDAMKLAANPLDGIKDILDPPYMRSLQETHKQLNEILNPPWAQALRDQQNLLKGIFGY